MTENEAKNLAQKYADEANRDHVITYSKIPGDVKKAYEACKGKPGDPMKTGVALAVRATGTGWWTLSVAGNPVLLETAIRQFCMATGNGAVSPDTLRLRKITWEETELFEEEDKKTLQQSLAAAALGRKGGSAKTEKKATASRENGKKGGRPRTLKNYVITKSPAGIIGRIEAYSPKEALDIFGKKNPGFYMDGVRAKIERG